MLACLSRAGLSAATKQFAHRTPHAQKPSMCHPSFIRKYYRYTRQLWAPPMEWFDAQLIQAAGYIERACSILAVVTFFYGDVFVHFVC